MPYVNNSNDDFLNKATKLVEENLSNELFGVSELAKELSISRSYLHRKIISATKTSVSQFIRQIRLKKAKEMLRKTSLTVHEVAYNVGFNSVTYFSKCFHDYYGYSPSEVGKRLEEEKENITLHVSVNKKRYKTILIPVISVLFLAILVTIIISTIPGNRKELEKSIAVLPPNYTKSDSDSTYFLQLNGTIGMIINNLSKINDVEKVIPWISVQQYINSKKTATKIAEELGVSYIITSSAIVTEDGNYLNIELINATAGNQEWSYLYEIHTKEFIKLPKIIANDIADKIDAEITQEEKLLIEKIPTLNTDAYNLYLKGRFFWNTRTENGIRTSLDLFWKAVEKDENYALAWSGLADAYCILSGYGWYTPKKEGEELAKECAKKALELDNNLAEAHTALGFLLCYNEWKWNEAEKELEEAIRLNPNYSFAHLVYSLLLDIKGNHQKARKEIDIALKLDPFAPVLHYVSATLYYNDEDFDKSLMGCQEVLYLQKNYTAIHWWLFKNYYQKRSGTEALNVLQKILQLDTLTEIYVDEANEVYKEFGLDGLVDLILKITNEVKFSHPEQNNWLYWESYLTEIYAISGRTEEALTLLEHCRETNSEGDRLVRLINSLDYNVLRNEKRFVRVIKKLGLMEYYNMAIEDNKVVYNTN